MEYKYNLVYFTFKHYVVLKNGDRFCLSVYTNKPKFSIITTEEEQRIEHRNNIDSCDDIYIKSNKTYYIFRNLFTHKKILKIKKEDFDYILFVRTAQKANLSYISLQQILNYHDGEKALEYLKERGLSVS